jgi:thiamine transport system substrate-binding protein
MRTIPLLLAVLLVAGALAGCTTSAPAPGTPAAPSKEVTLLTYSAFGLNKTIFDQFTNLTGYHVTVLAQGDAGEVVNRAIASKDHPVADALFGVDNALIYRAKAGGIFQPHESPRSAYVAERYKGAFRDASGALLATPFDYGYVELNHDTAWFRDHNVSLPVDLAQIADKTYAPLTVVENPQTSSPGFAFLLATVARFGENGTYTYKQFWHDFAVNGGKIATSWDLAYGDDFTQGYDATGNHDRPIVLSYSTSPAYNPMNGYGNATSANLDLRQGSWFQVEAIGVLANAKNPKGAEALIDYMMSQDVQEQGAFQQVEYPVLAGAAAPEAYATYAPEPLDPAHLDAAQIEAHREQWIAGWREATGQA